MFPARGAFSLFCLDHLFFIACESVYYNIKPSVNASIIVHARVKLVGSTAAAELEVPGSKPGLLSMDDDVGPLLGLELVEEAPSEEVVVDEPDDCVLDVEVEELDDGRGEVDDDEDEELLEVEVVPESAECEAKPMRELSKSKTV